MTIRFGYLVRYIKWHSLCARTALVETAARILHRTVRATAEMSASHTSLWPCVGYAHDALNVEVEIEPW